MAEEAKRFQIASVEFHKNKKSPLIRKFGSEPAWISFYVREGNLDEEKENKIRKIYALWNTFLIQSNVSEILGSLRRDHKDEAIREEAQAFELGSFKSKKLHMGVRKIIYDKLLEICDPEELDYYLSSVTLDIAESGNAEDYSDNVLVGADINFARPDSGFTALHYAASRDMRGMLKYLITNPNLNYLVKDAKGRLPSALAFEIANNSVTGTFLMNKEIRQAQDKGIDYRNYITSPV